jgi:DNA-directed RNA polymerase specialized sigma24 family protein
MHKQSNGLKDLIVRFKSGEDQASSDLSAYIYKLTRPIIRRFRIPGDSTDDLLLETTVHIMDKIREFDINNQTTWIKVVATNFLRTKYRKAHSKKGQTQEAIRGINPVVNEEKGTQLIDIQLDSGALIPGGKNYYGPTEEEIRNLYQHAIPPKTRRAIITVLGYIASIYGHRKQVRRARTKDAEFYRLSKIFQKTLANIKYISGSGIEKKAKRYEYFEENGMFDPLFDHTKLSDSEQQEFEEFDKLGWHLLPIRAYYKIDKLIHDAEIGTFFDRYPEKNFLGTIRSLRLSRDDILINIPNMRIEPPRLFYDILARVFKTEKKSDRKKIRLILRYLKIATRGKNEAFLFDSIPEDDHDFESTRTGRYKKPGPDRRKFYKRLVSALEAEIQRQVPNLAGPSGSL